MATVQRSPKESSKLVDQQLEAYRSMRDFSVTSEPAGDEKRSAPNQTGVENKSQSKQAAKGYPFVIQKHAASHLHYDFRLGWNGVLKSWAVAKGPSYVTKDKRLAVQVEDHPMEYGGFEGIIPQGQYGGGTVLLWDNGTWEPQAGHEDVDAGLHDGSLKFIMHGKKMKGKWALIRMGGRAAEAKKPQWLLIKEHDSFERTESDPAITDEAPESVVTGRELEEIARQKDHVWDTSGAHPKPGDVANPDQSDASARPSKDEQSAKNNAKPQPVDVSKYAKETVPQFIAPELALQAKAPPDQSGWVHELKLDGYRIQARKDGNKVSLLTRTGLDWTHRMKDIAAEIGKLPAKTAIIDGEVVVLSAEGTTSFADLQSSFRDGKKHPLTYFAFDLLHLNGHNLRGAELLDRKARLSSLIAPLSSDQNIVRLSEHLEGDGVPIFEHACKLRAEGIISKRASSKYLSGRSGSWLKIKCAYQQEFVIGGFTLPSNGNHGVGALLLGYYDEHNKLIYAGRTGTGFTERTHGTIRDQLEKIRVKQSGFEFVPPSFRRGVTWVKPQLVAQVGFATWTSDGLVRQAAFKGLREDKPAKDVRREVALNEPDEKPAKKATHAVASRPAARVASGSVNKKEPSDAAQVQHAAVRLTHPDKIVDEATGLTKQQLADYYWEIAEHMLPHIANRPLSLVRCPEGSTKPCFFQKHTSTALPPGIETIQVPDKKTGKPEPYITLSTREALAALAQMGVLELHPWGSTNDDLEHPDRIVIDLDPDESVLWCSLAEAALEVRGLLKKAGLESFLKSTGGKGLHVVVPIVPEHDWTIVKDFAHSVALELEKQSPDKYLSKMSKAARKGKIYVDYLRNERGSTSIAAFSPRARAGAPASIPLSWKELEEDERPVFRVADLDRWKSRLKVDPWKKLASTVQHLDPAKIGHGRGRSTPARSNRRGNPRQA